MENSELEQVTSPLINKLYALAYSIVPSDLEAEQLVVDSYTRFVVKDKEIILDTQIEDSFDRGTFSEYCLERIIQEICDLGKKRSQSYLYTKKDKFDEFNSYYDLSLYSRVIIHLSTVLDFSHSRMSKTLGIKKHEVVQLEFNATNELLKIGESNATR